MMIEIGGAQIFGIVVMVIAALAGMWTKRLQADFKEHTQRIAQLEAQLAELRERLAREASEYARRAEMEALMRRIEEKLDRMSDKLDSKQDKQA
ncbi:hypothetical protein ACOTJH_29090 [Achromobacter xylosoxidans]